VTQKWTGLDTFANSFFSVLSFTGVSALLREQLWGLTNDLYIGRFQPFCAFDNQIVGVAQGAVPSPWVYSTGFSRTPKPGFCTEISVLASGAITAKVAKTLEALETDEARVLVANSQLWRTEVDFSGPTDLLVGRNFVWSLVGRIM